MGLTADLHEFDRETECLYDGEYYKVRDNGSVMRLPRTASRVRPTDNYWTFGKPNSQNGYMYISQVRIHRIVATAFHGEPPTSEHVVDHIDTNRRNNRPENLRWLTRLENALLNPITVKRIEFICGSIEAFLENPSLLRHGSLDRSFEWMRTVTEQEAQACKERMDLWAKRRDSIPGKGSLGDWIFKPIKPSADISITSQIERRPRMVPPQHNGPQESDLVMAKTPGAAQREWRTPTEFPCCPLNDNAKTLTAYAANLTSGTIFSRNNFSTHIVLDVVLMEEGQSLIVMCEADGLKPWSLAKITFEEELFVHTSISTFFTKQGAEKQFTLMRGLEWTGEDSVDDYC